MAKYRTDFLNYMKEGENAALLKGSKGAKLLHKSPEGGTPTFGYGYKLSEKEWKEKKIGGVPIEQLTLKDAERLLQQALVSKENKVKERLKNGWKDPATKKIIKVNYDSLNDDQKEMLLDYEYNLKGGITKFPSFVSGVLTNDYDRIEKEYQRGYTTEDGEFRPLKARNELFSQRYLNRDNTNLTPTGAGGGRGFVNPEFNAPVGYDTIPTNTPVQLTPEETRNYAAERDVRNYSGMEPGIEQALEPQYATMEDLLRLRGIDDQPDYATTEDLLRLRGVDPNPEYATMEDLLNRRGIFKNDLL